MTEVEYLDPESIKVEGRYRQEYNLTTDFINNVEEHGIIQPIVINQDGKLLAGGRRLQAALNIGLDTVPCVRRPTEGPLAELEIELFENIHRKDMEWHEEAALTLAIHQRFKEDHKKWPVKNTAWALNKSRSAIDRELEVASLLDQMPQLREQPTMDKAVQTIKKVQEKVLVNRMKQKHFSNTKDSDHRALDADEEGSGKKSAERKKEQKQEDRVQRALDRANVSYMIGDALEGMRQFIKDNPDEKYVGLVEVDPPYAIELQKAKRTKSAKHANLDKYTDVDPDEYVEWLNELAPLTYECARNDAWLVFWYGHQWYYEVRTALEGAGWTVDPIPAIWTKRSGQTKQPEVNLARTYEPFLIGRKGSPLLRERGRSNVFDAPAIPQSLKYHPTQRPLFLMRTLLDTFLYPGDIVMSPFLGSGMTMIAAYMANLGCFGWDLEETYKDSMLLKLKDYLTTTDEEEPTYEQAVEQDTSSDSDDLEGAVEEEWTDDLEQELEELLQDRG